MLIPSKYLSEADRAIDYDYLEMTLLCPLSNLSSMLMSMLCEMVARGLGKIQIY